MPRRSTAIVRTSLLVVSCLVSFLVVAAQAVDQDEYCAGFAEGFYTVRPPAVPVPQCRNLAAVPHGSTPFREGLKDGIKEGRKSLKKGS